MPRTSLAAALFALLLSLSPSLHAENVLVVAFSNRTTDQSLDWLGESISESIRETLSTEGLTLVSRQDRQAALKKLALPASGQMTLASALKLGEAMEVTHLVHGEFQFDPGPAGGASRGALRIEARILDPKHLMKVADFSEVGAIEDLATLESDVAYHFLKWFHPDKIPARDDFQRRHPALKISALESYIRGLMSPTAEQQHRFFTQAVRLDPRLWQACYYLGRLHWEKENYREATGWLEKVTPDAEYYVEATYLLGLSQYHTSDFAGARAAFEKVLARRPGPEARNNLGAALARLNDPGALDQFSRALESDPKDPDYHFNVGYQLWRKGDFTAAAERFRAVLDREKQDQDALLLLGRCLKQSGPRAGDLRAEGLERLKESFEDATGTPSPR